MDILIVEDDEINIEIMEKHLKKAKYNTLCARDGLEGLEILKNHKVDMILLDRMMPNMNGMEFMAEIKKHDDLKDIPVIMETAADSNSEIVEGSQTGVFYYLTKPYTGELLLSLVKAVEEHLAKQAVQ